MFAIRTLIEERLEREQQCRRRRRCGVHVGVHQASLSVVDVSNRERDDRHSQHDAQPQGRCGLTWWPERSEFSVDDPTNSALAIVRDDLTWRPDEFV